jgi:putative FmdB family regulatory protein
MPIYEYVCLDCGKDFEELVSLKDDKSPSCPACHSEKTEKKISVFGRIAGSAGKGSSCGSSEFT